MSHKAPSHKEKRDKQRDKDKDTIVWKEGDKKKDKEKDKEKDVEKDKAKDSDKDKEKDRSKVSSPTSSHKSRVLSPPLLSPPRTPRSPHTPRSRARQHASSRRSKRASDNNNVVVQTPIQIHSLTIHLFQDAMLFGDIATPDHIVFKGGNEHEWHTWVDEIKRNHFPPSLHSALANFPQASASSFILRLVDLSNHIYIPQQNYEKLNTNNRTRNNRILSDSWLFTDSYAPALAIPAPSDTSSVTLTLITFPRQRHVLKLANTTTVKELYQYCKFLSQVHEPFDLIHGYPPHILDVSEMQLFQLGWTDGSIMQRLHSQQGKGKEHRGQSR